MYLEKITNFHSLSFVPAYTLIVHFGPLHKRLVGSLSVVQNQHLLLLPWPLALAHTEPQMQTQAAVF